MELLKEYLFENNPSPMWIFDADSLRFLAVNRSAQHKYKFSEEEFLEGNILMVRPESEHQKFLDNFSAIKKRQISDSLYWLHRDKDGNTFHVRIHSFSVQFQNKHARFVQILDVEDYYQQFHQNLKLIDELQLHIEFIKNLSWAHCHQLRGKISNLLAIHNLYMEDAIGEYEIPQMAKISHEELMKVDEIIKAMVHQMKIKCQYPETELLKN